MKRRLGALVAMVVGVVMGYGLATSVLGQESKTTVQKEARVVQPLSAEETKEFQRQWKEVRTKYPLVAHAFLMYETAAVESPRYYSVCRYAVLASSPLAASWQASCGTAALNAALVEQVQRQCSDQRDRCLGRSKTYEDGASCLSDWSACIRTPPEQ